MAKKAAEAAAPGERELVAALLLEPGALSDVRDLIAYGDFVDPRLGAVYRALGTVADRGDPAPTDDLWLVALANEAASNGALTHSAAQTLVGELVDERVLAPTGGYRFYARVLRERALRARVHFHVRRLDVLIGTSAEEEEQAWEALEAARAELRELLETDHVLGTSMLYGERLLERSLRPPPPTAVPGLLYPGNLTVLIGAPFVGKSFLALHLAASQASGIPPWPGVPNLDPFEPGRVLYVGYEGNAGDLVRRLRGTDTMTEPKRSPCAWSPNLAVLAHDEETRPSLLQSVKLHPEGIAKLAYTLRRDGPWRGLVIDTLAAGLPEGLDENSNADMTLVCSRLQTLAQQTGVWVLLIHHPPKTTAQPDSDVAIWALGRGAGGIAGTARALAYLDAPSPGQRRLRFQVNLSGTPKPMLFDVAPEDKPEELLYWKPTTPEDLKPEDYLRPGEWINATELAYRISRFDRSEKLSGAACRRAAATRIRWIADGTVQVRQGARRATEISLREPEEEVPF